MVNSEVRGMKENKAKISTSEDLLKSKVLSYFVFLIFVLLCITSIRPINNGNVVLLTSLWSLWIFLLSINHFKFKIGLDRTVVAAVVVLSLGQAAVFLNNGLLSGGPYVFMFACSFLGLIGKRELRLLSLGITILPIFSITVAINMGVDAPAPENIAYYATSSTGWNTLTLVAILFGVFLVQTSSLVMGKISKDRDSYQTSLFDSMVQLSLLRDQETGHHIQRCSEYSRVLLNKCKTNGYDTSMDLDIDIFCEAVRLHDVGKVGISDQILQKPGKLMASEFKIMQQHTLLGAQIIESIASVNNIQADPIIVMSIEIAKHHHENWDGTGYPYGRVGGMFGKHIRLESRIMAIVDVYDALRSKRPYKEAFSHEQALKIMKEMNGKKFDPNLFDLFLSVESDFGRIFSESVSAAVG